MDKYIILYTEVVLLKNLHVFIVLLQEAVSI